MPPSDWRRRGRCGKRIKWLRLHPDALLQVVPVTQPLCPTCRDPRRQSELEAAVSALLATHQAELLSEVTAGLSTWQCQACAQVGWAHVDTCLLP